MPEIGLPSTGAVDPIAAQAKLLATLEQRLSGATSLVEKIDALNALSRFLTSLGEDEAHQRLPRAIALAEMATELSSQGEFYGQPYQTGLAESLRNLADLYIQLSNYELALSFLYKSLAFLKEGQSLETRVVIQDSIGRIYCYLGEYASALEYHLEALQHRRELNADTSANSSTSIGRFGAGLQEIDILNNIARVYLNLGENQPALQSLHNCLRLVDRAIPWDRPQDAPAALVGGQAAILPPRYTTLSEAWDLQAQVYELLCSVHLQMNDRDQALRYGQESIRLYQRAGAGRGEAGVRISLGDLYRTAGRVEDAFQQYQVATQLAEKIGDRYHLAEGLLRQGRMLWGKQQSEAIELLLRCQDLAHKINARPILSQAHQSLAEYYEILGDPQKALDHLKQYHVVFSDVCEQKMSSQLASLQITHEVETVRKEAEISELRNVTLQQEMVERVNAQQALMLANEQLQQEISTREQLIADLDAFSHTVAHDLKTPLTSVALSTGLMRSFVDRIASILPDKPPEAGSTHPLLAPIYEHMDRLMWLVMKMNRIINELLVLASVRSQQIYLEALNMDKILDEVETRLEDLMQEYDAEIQRPESWPPVLGYAPWVEEVWSNYISNAILYGGRPPRMEVGGELILEPQGNGEQGSMTPTEEVWLNDSVGSSAPSSEPLPPPGLFVRFWVKDNGAGLEDETQANLFQPGQRGATGRLRAGGHGLGLSIVKRIVTKIGGSVGAENCEGGGSRFYFSLPAPSSTGEGGLLLDESVKPLPRPEDIFADLPPELRARFNR